MKIGDTVLVEVGLRDLPFEATVMGFAGDKVRVDWTEKQPCLFGLLTKSTSHTRYLDRSLVEVATMEDEYEILPDDISELFGKIESLGWFDFGKGRYTLGSYKEYPYQGKVGIRSKKFEVEVKAKSLRELLQKGIRELRANKDSSDEASS